jgi:hypothetical protein
MWSRRSFLGNALGAGLTLATQVLQAVAEEEDKDWIMRRALLVRLGWT